MVSMRSPVQFWLWAVKDFTEEKMQEIIQLECSKCKRRNYSTKVNKKNIEGKLKLKKYCKFDKAHTEHKQVK